MAVYTFDNASLIQEVDVMHSAGGRHTAYIRAREGADTEKLESVKRALTEAEMQWTPITRNGQAVLEVRNIGRSDRRLLHFLTDEGAISDNPKKQANPEHKVSAWDKFRSNTLRWSGVAYFIGDLSFITYGWNEAFEKNAAGKRKLTNPQMLFAGVFYALGSPFSYLFGGGDKSDQQLRNTAYDTLAYLKQKGIAPSQNSSIYSITHKHNSTVFKRIVNKVEHYPAELTNSFFGLAGIMIMWEGVKNFLKFKKETATGSTHVKNAATIGMDIMLGFANVLAGLVSFVPEEPRRPGEPRKPGLAGVWQWVEEKPLRTAGALLGLSTIGHAGSTVIGYRKAVNVLNDPTSTAEQREEAMRDKKGLPKRAVFTGINLGAEALMVASSKGHGKGVESDVSLEPSVYAVMADMILHSPQEKRSVLLDTVSGYLSQQEHLHLDKEKIKNGIQEQMEGLARNPWLNLPVSGKKEGYIQEESARQNTKWQDSVASSVNVQTSPTI